jgi:outer membrane translocation and assembly module TamA
MGLGRAKRAYNAVMRCQFVQFILLAIAYSLTWQPNTRAQVDVPAARSEAGTNRACSSPPVPVHKQSSTVQVTIAELTFNGDMQMPIEDRDKLSTSLQQQTFSGEVDGVKDQILETVRVAWQNHGYFNVHVQGDAKVLTRTPFSHAIAVTVLVDEGVQYRLEKITFNGNQEVSDLEALRRQFPLQDGDIFTRNAVSQGLENLRFAYLQLGHLNFTSIPNTEFDQDSQTVSLAIDIDEGKKFFISEVNFQGLDESASQGLLGELPLNPGNVYNQRLVNLALEAHLAPSAAGASPESRVHMQLDERAALVAITLDFRPCPVE